MSLSFDEIAEVHRAWEEMDERLNKLIGFNPATSNHYGIIQLYNQRINAETSDEKIIAIRTKFLKWRNHIFSIFAEKNYYPNAEQFNQFFSIDGMYGNLNFLDVPVDIENNAEAYRTNIYNYLERGNYNHEIH